MKLAALVSCAARNLTAAQRDALEARVEFAEPFPRRDGRMLLSCVAERADLQWMLDRMTAANLTPVLLAAFRSDTGQRIRAVPINRTEWLRVAPDVWNPTTGQFERPAGWRMVHTWAGWADQRDEEEPV